MLGIIGTTVVNKREQYPEIPAIFDDTLMNAETNSFIQFSTPEKKYTYHDA